MSSPDIMVCIVAYNSSSPFTYLFIHSSLIYFNRLVHHFMAYFGKKVILLMFGSTLDQFGIFFFTDLSIDHLSFVSTGNLKRFLSLHFTPFFATTVF